MAALEKEDFYQEQQREQGKYNLDYFVAKWSILISLSDCQFYL